MTEGVKEGWKKEGREWENYILDRLPVLRT